MIKLTPEQRDTLMARYDVSHVAIWEACNYITRGERPDSIRRDALALGGRYIEEEFIPQLDNVFLTGNNVIASPITAIEPNVRIKSLHLITTG